MEFKGTKGKWNLGGFTEDGLLISSNHPVNRDIATVWRYDNDYLEIQEMKANAQLIASAPEMFEMLKEIINANPMHDGYHSLVIKASNLLTKITTL